MSKIYFTVFRRSIIIIIKWYLSWNAINNFLCVISHEYDDSYIGCCKLEQTVADPFTTSSPFSISPLRNLFASYSQSLTATANFAQYLLCAIPLRNPFASSSRSLTATANFAQYLLCVFIFHFSFQYLLCFFFISLFFHISSTIPFFLNWEGRHKCMCLFNGYLLLM